MRLLARNWYRLRESFWFLPAMIVLAATVLAFVAIDVDARFVTEKALEPWPRLFGAGSSGSRSLLTAVAGSMITVAGTVFSITLVALSLASSQYSSRVMRNFMRDRTNQSVLGIFVGIFAYCLVVLRSIHGNGDEAFVPSVAVLLALLLGFGGIGVLVFFIHHIAQSIQASQILEAVRTETVGAIDRLFPRPLLSVGNGIPALEASSWHEAGHARTSGYLQFVDFSRLRAIAQRGGLQLRVAPAIGAFVIEGEPVVHASLAPRPGLQGELADCWSIGPQRTLQQDIGFGIRQLVDVALKALSPGINDTTTATMCIDTLTAVLVHLSARELRFPECDGDGVTWVHAHHPRFGDLLDVAFNQVRHAGGDNAVVLDRLCWSLARLQSRAPVLAVSQAVHQHALRLEETAQRELHDSRDRARLQSSLKAILHETGKPSQAAQACRRHD